MTRIFALIIVLVSFGGWASASLPNHYKTVGEALLEVMWFDIYSARLATESGHYNSHEPIVLELTYHRDFTAKSLLEETAKQWKQWTTPEQSLRWLMQLEALWPDVERNQRITFWRDKSGHSHFFFNEAWLGVIKDQQFGVAFANIWLSKDSQFPNLAAKLKGVNQ